MEINLTEGHREIRFEYKPITKYQASLRKAEFGYLTDDIITGIKIQKNVILGRIKI